MMVWYLVLVVVGHHAVAVTTIPIGGSGEQCLREAKLYNDTTGYRASCTRGVLK